MKNLIQVFCIFLLITVSLELEAAEPIKAGERVRLDFTCRLHGGEIAATTDSELSEQPEAVRSSIFRKWKSSEPVFVSAGSDETANAKPGRRSFEEEIIALLGKKVVGMQPGNLNHVELSASIPKEQSPEDRFAQMARVRSRPKELRMSRDRFLSQTGKEPVMGQGFTIDPAFPGKIASVSDQEVVVTFSAVPGGTIDSPIGKGTIRDAGKHWEVDIDAREGELVRIGPIVGRIVSVDERTINIDFGKSFGGEVLTCNVKASIQEEVKK